MKIFKLFLSTLPLFVWGIWGLWMQYVQYDLRDVVTDVNPSIWSEHGIPLRPELSSKRKGEIDETSISIFKPNGDSVFRFVCEIDRDMGGNGFIGAMNVDTDPEPEILCYRNTFGGSLYLDVRSGHVDVLPFEQVAVEIRDKAKRWQDANYPNSFTILAGIILTLLYYALFGILIAVKSITLRIMKRFNKGEHADQSNPDQTE